MSHIATVKVAFPDREVTRSACQTIGATYNDTIQEHKLYSSQKVVGRTVQLDGWKYPVVISPDGTELFYDNYNGAWGDINKLNAFKSAYAAAATFKEITADENLIGFQQTTLADGTIEITAETVDRW